MLTLSQAARLTGIPQQTLSHWLQWGLVQPKGWKNKASQPVPITAKEIREFMIIRRLRKSGLSMRKVKRIAAFLRSLGANPFSVGEFLAIESGEVYRIINRHEAMALLKKPGQLLLLMPLPEDPPGLSMEEQNGAP